MLIWIKAPRVAIGVIAALVLLLSSVVSEEISINTTADNLGLPATELTISAEIETLQLMQLPFANSLLNPCSLENERALHDSIKGHRAEFVKEFFNELLVYATMTKQKAQEVLQNQTISNCATLPMFNLPHTPTLNELKETNMEGALNKIYSSLLVHSSYTYFIYHQFNYSGITCSKDINEEKRLAELSLSLALEQQFLACRVRLGMAILGYSQDDTPSVLNERITDLSQCSLRALRDCQVMKSIYNFLHILTTYASDDDSESTTSLPPFQRTMP